MVKIKKIKILKIPFWMMDGFNGILALVIYNFFLFIVSLLGIKGILGEIESIMGYFGLNFLIKFSLNKPFMLFGVMIIFFFSFFLGVLIAELIRRFKHERNPR